MSLMRILMFILDFSLRVLTNLERSRLLSWESNFLLHFLGSLERCWKGWIQQSRSQRSRSQQSRSQQSWSQRSQSQQSWSQWSWSQWSRSQRSWSWLRSSTLGRLLRNYRWGPLYSGDSGGLDESSLMKTWEQEAKLEGISSGFRAGTVKWWGRTVVLLLGLIRFS